MQDAKALDILTKVLRDTAQEPMVRHEVAFVLGQLQEPCSIPFLQENLEDRLENEMVRHECAEALGAIATEDCIKILNRYAEDANVYTQRHMYAYSENNFCFLALTVKSLGPLWYFCNSCFPKTI